MFTTIPFSKGDFLLQYKGDFISGKEGEEREDKYPEEAGNFYTSSQTMERLVGMYLSCRCSKVNLEKA